MYYSEGGYGSLQQTLKESRQKDYSITIKDVKEFMRENEGKSKQEKGNNTFVAPYPFYEFQIDLLFFSDLHDQKFPLGMVCIDVFSKYACVVPLANKREQDLASGIIECLHKMKKAKDQYNPDSKYDKPDIIYTDDEPALRTSSIQTYLKEQRIQHIITRSHAWFAERFVRTFKLMIYKRIDSKKNTSENPQWHDYIFQVLLTYNKLRDGRTNGVSPVEALSPDKCMEVSMKQLLSAKRNRKYPELKEGDKVKILRKRQVGEKERVSTFSKEVFKVDEIKVENGQNRYQVSGKWYLRNELLKQ